MDRYAQIEGSVVVNIIESETDPDGVNGRWVACGDSGAGPGWLYDAETGVFSEPPFVPPPAPAWERLIDIGPFFDRFGAAKMAVLTSADAGVQAILKDTQIRKWLDLKLPEVAESVAYVGTKVPAVTAELQDAILNTPVAEAENLALRKLYFS
jgi:hypothetical protein